MWSEFGHFLVLPASTEKTTSGNDLSLFQSPLEPAFGSLHGQNLSLQFLKAQLKTFHLSGPSLRGRHTEGLQSGQTHEAACSRFHPSHLLIPELLSDLFLRSVLVFMKPSELLLVAGPHPQDLTGEERTEGFPQRSPLHRNCMSCCAFWTKEK